MKKLLKAILAMCLHTGGQPQLPRSESPQKVKSEKFQLLRYQLGTRRLAVILTAICSVIWAIANVIDKIF